MGRTTFRLLPAKQLKVPLNVRDRVVPFAVTSYLPCLIHNGIMSAIFFKMFCSHLPQIFCSFSSFSFLLQIHKREATKQAYFCLIQTHVSSQAKIATKTTVHESKHLHRLKYKHGTMQQSTNLHLLMQKHNEN